MGIETSAIYGLMGSISLIIAYRSYKSYKRTGDRSLFYFTFTFFLFSLYLLVLSFLSYLFVVYNISKLFDVGYAIARFFIVLGIFFLFQTTVFQSSRFLSRHRVFISTLILFSGFVSLYMQVTNFQDIFISSSGIIIQPVKIIPAMIATALTYWISISWTYITVRDLPGLSSYIFSIKTYLIAIGGILLATGDTMYVFATHLPDTFYGPIINLTGYLFVVTALMLPIMKRFLLNKR